MLVLDTTWQGAPSQKLRGLPRIAKEELRVLVKEWHEQRLPLHFKPSAVGRYRYEPREAWYSKRKERIFGHRNPLEFTGDTKRNVLATIRISGTSKNVRGRMSGAQALNYKGKYVELVAVSEAEKRRMSEKFQRRATKRINEYRPRRRRRRHR